MIIIRKNEALFSPSQRRAPRLYLSLVTLVFVVGSLYVSNAFAQEPTPPGTTDKTVPSTLGTSNLAPKPDTSADPTKTGATKADSTSVNKEPVQNLRLRALQNRVVSLKQEVFQTKTRLMLIKERLLNNVIAEAKLTIHHSNSLSGAFSIQEVIYYLDDNKIYYGDSRAGNLTTKKEFDIFNGNVVPGHHVLGVETVLVGNSTLFPYVGDFKFRLRSNYTFFAPRGRITVLSPTLYEKGGLLRDFRDRPSVKYGIKQYPYTRENMEKVAPEPAKND